MPMVIYASIRHDGKDWIVKHDAFEVRGKTLDEIDEKVKQVVREKGLMRGGKAQVYMAYDNNAIPQWIRQYSSHYFDRVVEL
ncbi:MAG: hypothetical protein GXO99_03090 [Nitrospirae bacterium]|nr:hypothetical protein [Nitrospirota bacterium]